MYSERLCSATPLTPPCHADGIDEDVADCEHGGGVFVGGASSVVITAGSQVANNLATGCGGGVYGSTNTKIVVSDQSTVANNAAIRAGGGLHGAWIALKGGSRIVENFADREGGGVFVRAAGSLTTSNGSCIAKNMAYHRGGGISCGVHGSISVSALGTR